MNEKKENGFIGFDYKEIKTDSGQAPFILDGYENFGWQIDGHFDMEKKLHGKDRTVIRMKRDRKIMNRAELTRLQRNFEDCLDQMLY